MPSMKLTPAERKENRTELAIDSPADEEQFPFGLTVNLEDESMDKLGTDLLEVGDEVLFTAVSKVTHVHESASAPGDKHKSMTLQTTDMEIVPPDSDIAKKLYG